MSGWGCPHEAKGRCLRLKGRDCRPGQPGCLLHGRFAFYDPGQDGPGPEPGPKAQDSMPDDLA